MFTHQLSEIEDAHEISTAHRCLFDSLWLKLDFSHHFPGRYFHTVWGLMPLLRFNGVLEQDLSVHRHPLYDRSPKLWVFAMELQLLPLSRFFFLQQLKQERGVRILRILWQLFQPLDNLCVVSLWKLRQPILVLQESMEVVSEVLELLLGIIDLK